MDRPDNPPEDLDAALRDLRRINRHLGGRRALLDAVTPWLRHLEPGATLDVLDVGTGSGDLPQAVWRLARARGRRARVLGVDLDPHTAAVAARDSAGLPGVQVVRADARRLPLGERSVDLVTASLFLHHFPEDEIVAMLARWRRLARLAVLVNDLRRHPLAWASIWALTRLARCHPMVVHDGPLSVRRGFTDAELLDLARRAGATSAQVRRRFPYRLVLTAPAHGVVP